MSPDNNQNKSINLNLMDVVFVVFWDTLSKGWRRKWTRSKNLLLPSSPGAEVFHSAHCFTPCSFHRLSREVLSQSLTILCNRNCLNRFCETKSSLLSKEKLFHSGMMQNTANDTSSSFLQHASRGGCLHIYQLSYHPLVIFEIRNRLSWFHV